MITAFLLGFALAQTPAHESVLLRFHPKVGASYTFKNTTKSVAEVGGKVMPGMPEMDSSATYHILSFAKGLYKIKMTLNLPKELKNNPAIAKMGLDKPVVLDVDDHFKPKGAPQASALFQALLSTMKNFALPEAPLHVGSVWSYEDSQGMKGLFKQLGGEGNGQVTAKMTVTGFRHDGP